MRALLILLALTACTTPQTVLENKKTGQIVMCGGNVGSSLAGGVIGYHIQKGNDEKCVTDFLSRGFKITSRTNSSY